jgi:hypothetical protein
MRLGAAGCNKKLFTSDAVAMRHEATSGSLRDVDRVAHSALRRAARKKRKLVERLERPRQRGLPGKRRGTEQQ